MDALKITLTPQTAFGTPLVGDTLFGHLCWGIAEAYGADRLRELLHGYCDGTPFLIASDAFPANYLPLPTLPSAYWTAGDETDRKKLKKKQWLPLEALTKPVRDWQRCAKSNDDIAANLISSHSQAHNSINRATRTTSTGAFAPFASEQNWYGTNSQWQLYLLHDPARITRDELAQRYESDIASLLLYYGEATDRKNEWAQRIKCDALMQTAHLTRVLNEVWNNFIHDEENQSLSDYDFKQAILELNRLHCTISDATNGW